MLDVHSLRFSSSTPRPSGRVPAAAGAAAPVLLDAVLAFPSSPSRVAPPPASNPASMAQPQRPGMFGGGPWAASPVSPSAGCSARCYSAAVWGQLRRRQLWPRSLLVGGAAFFLFRMLRGRSQAQPAYAGADGRAPRAAGPGMVVGRRRGNHGSPCRACRSSIVESSTFAAWTRASIRQLRRARQGGLQRRSEGSRGGT
jgi:hypothetical protein